MLKYGNKVFVRSDFMMAEIWIEVLVIMVIVAATGFISSSIGIKKNKEL